VLVPSPKLDQQPNPISVLFLVSIPFSIHFSIVPDSFLYCFLCSFLCSFLLFFFYWFPLFVFILIRSNSKHSFTAMEHLKTITTLIVAIGVPVLVFKLVRRRAPKKTVKVGAYLSLGLKIIFSYLPSLPLSPSHPHPITRFYF